MGFGNIGKVLAGQAIEATKKNVLDALRTPETARAAEKIQAERPAAPAPADNIGAIVLGQIQGMQRALKEDQELVVLFRSATRRCACSRSSCPPFTCSFWRESTLRRT